MQVKLHSVNINFRVLKRDVKSAQVRQRVQMRMPRVMSAPPIQRGIAHFN